MHYNGDSVPSPEELAQQARAHALEASLTTMEEFLEQEDKVIVTAYEPTYRASGDSYGTFAQKIATLQTAVASRTLSEEEAAQRGFEPTRFIPLVDPRRRSAFMVVYYEGELSGAKGYGVLNAEALLSTVEMEAFTSPQHLLEVYGDEAVLTAARAINDRNDELRFNSAL